MTAILVGPALTYRSLLAEHHDAMVASLVSRFQLSPEHAGLMIDQLWDRLTSRLVVDYAHLGVDLPKAERIMNEALGFLKLCAVKSGYGPSPLVDLGWHTFILYTMEYTAFSVALTGEYMHHGPTDVVGLNALDGKCDYKCANKCMNKCSSVSARLPDGIMGQPSPSGSHATIDDTAAAMSQIGPVDMELWMTATE